MSIRNPNHEHGADKPRRLTPYEQEAVSARHPLRYAAARNVIRAVELSYPEAFQPVVQQEPTNVVSMDAYRQPAYVPAQPEVAYESQPMQPEMADGSEVELARQAIANVFNPQPEQTDVKEAA